VFTVYLFTQGGGGGVELKQREGERGNSSNSWVKNTTLIKNESQIFLISKEIQSGAVAKSYVRKGFLIYEEMRKYFPIYEEAVSHI
jgi:hypothetical protein